MLREVAQLKKDNNNQARFQIHVFLTQRLREFYPSMLTHHRAHPHPVSLCSGSVMSNPSVTSGQEDLIEAFGNKHQLVLLSPSLFSYNHH